MTDNDPAPMPESSDTVTRAASRRITEGPVSEVTSEQRTLAMLAHLLGIFTHPFGSLIIWLIKKDDEFVEDQAREALNFQITVLIGLAAGAVLLIVMIGVLVIIGIAVLNIVFCVIAAAHAHGGETYRYPICLRLIKAPE